MSPLGLALWACAAAPGLDAAELRRFKALHARIYGVYELPREPDRVHDLLAGSLVGEALTRAYVEHWTTLARMEEETSVAIEEVAYDRVEPLDGRRLEAGWRVLARVTHQGHVHLRHNRYQAVFSLAGDRINGSWVRNAERLPGALPAEEERVPLGELMERL